MGRTVSQTIMIECELCGMYSEDISEEESRRKWQENDRCHE